MTESKKSEVALEGGVINPPEVDVDQLIVDAPPIPVKEIGDDEKAAAHKRQMEKAKRHLEASKEFYKKANELLEKRVTKKHQVYKNK